LVAAGLVVAVDDGLVDGDDVAVGEVGGVVAGELEVEVAPPPLAPPACAAPPVLLAVQPVSATAATTMSAVPNLRR
jgi:hypothetical protein